MTSHERSSTRIPSSRRRDTASPEIARRHTTVGERAKPPGRYLALAGVIGPPLFVLVFTVAGFLRGDYSALRDPISDLGVGEASWVQNANFLTFGTLLLVFAVAFVRAMRDVIGRNAAITGAILIALTGIGVFASGVFTAAPETEILHFLLGFLLAFGSAIVTIAFVGRRTRRADGWERFARYSRFTTAGAVGLIAFSFVALNPESPLEEAGIGGLIERALAIEVFAWHAVLGWRLFREPSR